MIDRVLRMLDAYLRWHEERQWMKKGHSRGWPLICESQNMLGGMAKKKKAEAESEGKRNVYPFW